MMENPVQIRSYLEGIYSTVLLKDVIARNRIRDTAVLEKIILYIADNTGNIFSTKRISDFMSPAAAAFRGDNLQRHKIS